MSIGETLVPSEDTLQARPTKARPRASRQRTSERSRPSAMALTVTSAGYV